MVALRTFRPPVQTLISAATIRSKIALIPSKTGAPPGRNRPDLRQNYDSAEKHVYDQQIGVWPLMAARVDLAPDNRMRIMPLATDV